MGPTSGRESSISRHILGISTCGPERAARGPAGFLSTTAVHNSRRLSTELTGPRTGPKRWICPPAHSAPHRVCTPISRMQDCCRAGVRTRCPQPGALIHSRDCSLPPRWNRRLAASSSARLYAGPGADPSALSGGVTGAGRAHVNAPGDACAVHKRDELSTGTGDERGRVDMRRLRIKAARTGRVDSAG